MHMFYLTVESRHWNKGI